MTGAGPEHSAPWAVQSPSHALWARMVRLKTWVPASSAQQDPTKGQQVKKPARDARVATVRLDQPHQLLAQPARGLVTMAFRRPMNARFVLSDHTALKALSHKQNVQPAQREEHLGSVRSSFAPPAPV